MKTLRIPLICAVGPRRSTVIRLLDWSVDGAIIARLARLRLLCATQNLESCQIMVPALADDGCPVSMVLTLYRDGTFSLSQGQDIRSKSLPFSMLWSDNSTTRDSHKKPNDLSEPILLERSATMTTANTNDVEQARVLGHREGENNARSPQMSDWDEEVLERLADRDPQTLAEELPRMAEEVLATYLSLLSANEVFQDPQTLAAFKDGYREGYRDGALQHADQWAASRLGKTQTPQ